MGENKEANNFKLKTHFFRKPRHFQAPFVSLRRPLPATTYSGYGEYGGQFFYYGNMSKYAYENKFKYMRSSNAENSGGELDEETNKSPRFDLVIGVQLR